MSQVGQKEILTQQNLIAFFENELGYQYLGNWKDRDGNSNIEEDLLGDWLKRQRHDEKIIGRVLYELDKAKAVSGNKTLYDANREVYSLLRYGVKVSPDVVEHDGPASVAIRNTRTLELRVRPGTEQEKRREALQRWYRQRLRDQIPDLLAKWEPIIGNWSFIGLGAEQSS